MNTRTGEIITEQEAIELNRQLGIGSAILMQKEPTPIQNRNKKVGRNDPCPCGSGQKFKKCHLMRNQLTSA